MTETIDELERRMTAKLDTTLDEQALLQALRQTIDHAAKVSAGMTECRMCGKYYAEEGA